MNRLARKTSLVFGGLLLLCIIGIVVLYQNPNDPGKLGAFGAFFFTICLVIAWFIQLFIDHRAAKLPARPLTPDQQKRYERNKVLVIIGLIILLLSPFLFGH